MRCSLDDVRSMIASATTMRSTHEWMPDDLSRPSVPGDDGSWLDPTLLG
jgi:hypothetical protein